MTVREICGHIKGRYSVAVSPGLISLVTDAILEDVKVWQARTLEALCPLTLKRGKPDFIQSDNVLYTERNVS